ncbi:MAG: Rieske (2Fe-2S) protein [Terrimicrobiaceae bacterium]|nr:Rieske (2Fe-2S) protein [Terrimicrobiaceae bacterium]
MTPDAPKETTPAAEGCACQSGTAVAAPTSRRNFLLQIGIGLNVLAGALISVPILGYVLSSFAKKFPLEWINLGSTSQFPEGTTQLASYENPYRRPWDGEMARIPCWVRHISANDFQVFAINCAHLGCPVRWFSESKLFMCPCHGGAYYENGDHAAGPPPRGLFTYECRVTNGSLEIKGGILPNLGNPGNPTEVAKPA